MDRMRRARITMLSTALAVASATVAGPLASAGSAEAGAAGQTSPPPAATHSLAVRDGHSLRVDPDPADGAAHHPLSLYVQASGIDGTPLVTTATPTGYSPATIKQYLGLSTTGSGQTIAIVVAYNAPTIAADLATFDSKFGLPAPPSFKKVSSAGSTTSLPATDANWALEASLDVEWAHALAPAASILLVEAKTSSLADLDTAIDYAAKQSGVSVISNSWGTTGEIGGEALNDSHCKLTKATCVFSTGDSGNPGGYPAYSPWVLAVGGTTLNLATDATGAVSVSGEVAWSGSGGGASIYETKPAYQAASGSASGRGIPDVSYDADPNTGFAVYDSTPYNGSSGWFQMGGTSAGAPQWAAILAVANQQRVAKKKAVLAAYITSLPTYRLHTDLYGLTTGLADITSGSTNGTCSICTAGPGYDYVTGRGSPRKGIDVALLNAA
jgi:subtilase family serine protease